MPDITYIESSNHLAAKEVRWRVAVGRFILTFGSIEWFTYHMLAELPTERIFESTKSLGFAQRTALVVQLLRERGFDNDLTETVVELLLEAKKLAKKRNEVAHNPLFLNLFDDRVGKELEYQISGYGELEPRITIDELEDLCRKAEEISETLGNVRELIESGAAQ